MSLDSNNSADERPLTTLDQLLAYFHDAERRSQGLVGLEHEKILSLADGKSPVPYEGPSGIGALFEKLKAYGWAEVREAPGLPVIALARGQATLSLEPGGQFELSGSPAPTAREAHAENVAHLRELEQATQALGLKVQFVGYRPHGTPAQMPWMPKTRYQVMKQTLGARGALAHDMMLMTATGQVSLDYRDEADCGRKVTAAARFAPLLVALYANSPLRDGEPSGYASFRSRVWAEVDPKRCGYPSCIVDGDFSYARYVEWALEAPLLFLRREGRYLAPPLTFRQLFEGGYQGQPALLRDWVDHLSTLFPEVRVKRVIEFRSADCVGPDLTGALAALLRGIFYDSAALDEAAMLLPWRDEDFHLSLHAAAQRHGLEATVDGISFRERARALVEIADAALGRLDPLDRPLLAPLLAR